MKMLHYKSDDTYICMCEYKVDMCPCGLSLMMSVNGLRFGLSLRIYRGVSRVVQHVWLGFIIF